MSNDPPLNCDELISIAHELVEKLRITNQVSDDFEFNNYPQDIAEIRHVWTNYDDVLYELESIKVPARLLDQKPEIPPQYVNCICSPDETDCFNELHAYSIIKQAANELARQIYRDL